MTTASIVAFKTDPNEIKTAIKCVLEGGVNKIWIIDNSPTNSLESVIKNIDHVTYFYGQGNVGYGRGHNIALREAIREGSKYHLVLNSDIFFQSGVLLQLENYMDYHPEVGYMIPKVFGINGDVRPICRLLPTPIDIFAKRFFSRKRIEKKLEIYELKATQYDKIVNTPNLSGCFMFLRISVLEKIGLFDERFFMYFEDLDLIRRIHAVSETLFYPECSITHKYCSEHRSNKKLFLKSLKSAIQYFNKWGWLFDNNRKRINNEIIRKYIINQ